MQFLLNNIVENQRINRLLERVAELPGHQGSVLSFSDDFIAIHQLYASFGIRQADSLLHRYFDRMYSRRGHSPFSPSLLDFIYQSVGPTAGNLDAITDKEFNHLSEISNELDLMPPMRLEICIFNDAKQESFREAISGFETDNDGRQQEFSIVLNRRPVNLASGSRDFHDSLVGGISIGEINDSVKYGTLSGVLRGKDGKHYGVTCAHVAGSAAEILQPARSDSKAHARMGKVIYSSTFDYCDADYPCQISSSTEQTDLSLIEITERAALGRIHKLGEVSAVYPFRNLQSGNVLEFNGRSTDKRKQVYIGGLCLTYKVAYQTEKGLRYACFKNLIELRSIPSVFFQLSIAKRPVKKGDSGAWVCHNDSKGYAWAGIIISADIDRGYFLPSEHLLTHLARAGYEFDLPGSP